MNTSVWSTFTNGNHGARINSGRLEITSRRSSSAHGQGFAYVNASGAGSPYAPVFNPVLAANGGLITWTFNMRKPPSNATTNGGFDCTDASNQNGRTIGIGYVLGASTASGMLSATTNCNPNGSAVGYAVLHGGTNRMRLVRFENAIHNGTLTTIAQSQTISYANYHSVRVTYDPATSVWTLEVRSDGTGSFADPSIGSYPSVASGTDAVHVNTALPFSGGYFQAGCIGVCDDASSGYIAFFDNIRVTLACVPPPVPGPIAGNTTVCGGAEEDYSVAEVSGASAYTWSYSGSGVVLVPQGAAVSLQFGAQATSGVLSVSAVGACASAPSTVAVTVQPLPNAPQSLAGPLQLCSGSVGTYSISELQGESYQWQVPAGWTGPVTGSTVAYQVVAPGGLLTVTATNSCGDGPAATLQVLINELPAVTLAQFPFTCVGGALVPMAGGLPEGGTYTFSGAAITAFNPAVGVGSYPITYTFTDGNGCTASAISALEVDACASISERASLSFAAWPVPARWGELQVQADGPGTLQLLDAAGRIVHQWWYPGAGPQLAAPFNPPVLGNYLLRFMDLQGHQAVQRIVIFP